MTKNELRGSLKFHVDPRATESQYFETIQSYMIRSKHMVLTSLAVV